MKRLPQLRAPRNASDAINRLMNLDPLPDILRGFQTRVKSASVPYGRV